MKQEEKNKENKKNIWLRAILAGTGTIIIALLVYLTAVVIDYERVEDRQELEIVTETVPAAENAAADADKASDSAADADKASDTAANADKASDTAVAADVNNADTAENTGVYASAVDNANAVVPLSAVPPQTDTQYRLVSANVGFGAYSADYSFFMDGGKESRARSAEEAKNNILGEASSIAAEKPDFVFIQELDTDGTRSWHVDQREQMKTAFAGREVQSVFAQNYDSAYLLYPFNCPIGANTSGLMTYTTFPASSAVRRSLPIETGIMKFVDLDRCYSVTRIPMENGKELLLYNLHLSAYTSDGTVATEQLKMLCGDMKAEYDSGNWCIAGGDFNKDLLGNSAELFGVPSPEGSNWAQPIPEGLIPEGLTLAAPYDPEHPQASCRTAAEAYNPLTTFRVTVDGFLVSDNVEIVDTAVIDNDFAYSDHNPVRLDFILKES